jgi:hypothetical protein
MPYGGERILTIYRGELPSTDKLPYDGWVRLGDMWMVRSVPWIWTVAPGALTPNWIDP